MYSASRLTVRRSEDGGRTWADSGEVDPGVRVIVGLETHPLDCSLLYAVTTDGLYVSRDEAATWAALLRPQTGGWTDPELRFRPADPATLFLLNGSQLWESAEAGQSWNELGTDLPEGLHLNDVAVDPLHPSRLYVATSIGVFRKEKKP